MLCCCGGQRGACLRGGVAKLIVQTVLTIELGLVIFLSLPELSGRLCGLVGLLLDALVKNLNVILSASLDCVTVDFKGCLALNLCLRQVPHGIFVLFKFRSAAFRLLVLVSSCTDLLHKLCLLLGTALFEQRQPLLRPLCNLVQKVELVCPLRLKACASFGGGQFVAVLGCLFQRGGFGRLQGLDLGHLVVCVVGRVLAGVLVRLTAVVLPFVPLGLAPVPHDLICLLHPGVVVVLLPDLCV